MRQLTLGIALCLAALPAWAQQRTLISGDIESGGYGAPVVKISWLNGEAAVVVGAQGGWIINHSFCSASADRDS